MIIASLSTSNWLEHLWGRDRANWNDHTDCSAGGSIGYACLHVGIAPGKGDSHLSIKKDLAVIIEIDTKMRTGYGHLISW